jgi:hypothetical protein
MSMFGEMATNYTVDRVVAIIKEVREKNAYVLSHDSEAMLAEIVREVEKLRE